MGRNMRYDTVYLTCSKQLTDVSLVYHTEWTKNVKEKKTKNKLMSVISLVQSHDREGSPMGK